MHKRFKISFFFRNNDYVDENNDVDDDNNDDDAPFHSVTSP